MNNPLISVIIPVYNGGKYISNILQCLQKQTLQDFEVIFVNDGSKDNSKNLLENYCQQHNDQYSVITQENKGVSAARNNGIKHAQGEYICFIDVDDSIHEYYFELLYRALDNNNNAVAFCNTASQHELINEDSLNIDKYTNMEALEKYLYREITPGIWGMIIPKQILEDNDISFKEGFKYSEDMHMVWKVFNYAQNINHLKLPLYIYNENDGSAMSKIDKSRMDSIYLMKDIESFFKECNPNFYPLYKKYGVARASWSLLWQVAHYLQKNEFIEFTKLYPFRGDMKKLKDFPKNKVRFIAYVYIFSKYCYYYLIKIIMMNYRKGRN